MSWRIFLLSILFWGAAAYPDSAKSGEFAVAYVLVAKGEVGGRYKPGDVITLGSRIQLRPGDRLEAYHIRTCHWIRISGVISLQFRRASYQPRRAPKIELLKAGCAPISRPKGSDSGIVMRGASSQKVTSTPTIVVHMDNLDIRQIEFTQTKYSSDIRVLDLPPDKPVFKWPNGIGPLQRGRTYNLTALRAGKSIKLGTKIQVKSFGDPGPASNLVVIDLSERN